MDISLDVLTGDAVFNNATLVASNTTQTKKSDLGQRLILRLSTFRGEWFLDTTFGVPWFTELLGKKVGKGYYDAIIQSEIRKEPDVIEILDYTSTYDSTSRNVSIQATIRSTNDTILTLTSDSFNTFSII